jgi:RNA polymerase sigma factor (sigma-70 family)
MDHESLVRRAGSGDVRAFMELTLRFQNFAFGSALVLVRDFQQAEDVVQEALMAAWAALPTLDDPAAFPGWLRTIVRHHAFRVLRRKHLQALPLTAAAEVPSEEPAADYSLEQRQRATVALAAIAELPDALREPATLFFVHECSHQDIATFLSLPLATLNNRLHAARKQLKQRMLTMVTETLHAHALPDAFAHRVGRLIEARGKVVEALFDAAALPDLLSDLAISDEAQGRAVAVQIVQRPGGGIVRGIAVSQVDSVPRGATILSSGRQSETPVSLDEIGRVAALLSGQPRAAAGTGKILETGIKVIDVICPLAADGTVAVAGSIRAGIVVVAEEMVRRLSGGTERASLFVLVPPPSPENPIYHGKTLADQLHKAGCSEGTVGAVQTFFLRSGCEPWTQDRLSALTRLDTVIHLSRERASANIYPPVDVLTSRSRLLEEKLVSADHAAIAGEVRQLLAELWVLEGHSRLDGLMLERALKLQNYFTQPFFVAEAYTKRPGVTVSLAEALSTCRGILDGQYDDLPTDAFFFSGDIPEIRTNIGRSLSWGPVVIKPQAL